MKGRKPKPSIVHKINGNPGKRRRNRREPIAPAGIPKPFNFLSDEVKAAWIEIAGVLNKMRVLAKTHVHPLEQMSENLVEIRTLRDEIAKHGRFQNIRMTNGSKKQVVRPAVLALSDAEKRFRSMLEQFGMTPSAATRVTALPAETPKDPAAEFFHDDDPPPRVFQ